MPMESYDDDEDEQEGPKSSFGTYLAEGDALFKQSEYKKALESYSLALELQPNDKTCLVARSKCYLKLGDSQKALQDAEDALAENKEYNKGLYRKAEALYCMGDFEYALMYYHRGYKLRPELEQFRLGIQKAQEAIDNSIGSAAKIKLENKGDLSFFTKQDDLSNKKRGYTKPARSMKAKPTIALRNKEVKPPAPSKKTVKQLLGELYADKEYLEKLMDDEEFIKSNPNRPIYELVQGGISYLETRTEFWRQQKPLYARKKDKDGRSKPTKKKTKPSVGKYVLRQLEQIDQALANGNAEESLRLGMSLLKAVEDARQNDLPNKEEVVANIHSCIGNAHVELEQLTKALKHHQKDLEICKKSKLKDGKSRALDNVGRVYARMGKFEKAVKSWNEKLPMVKTPLESAWLFHEIGRCHLELCDYEEAKSFGEKSLSAAKECEDEVWQLNATVLVAQTQVKLDDLDKAVESFNDAHALAVSLSDEAAQTAISKALEDLEKKIQRGLTSGLGSADEDHHTDSDRPTHKDSTSHYSESENDYKTVAKTDTDLTSSHDDASDTEDDHTLDEIKETDEDTPRERKETDTEDNASHDKKETDTDEETPREMKDADSDEATPRKRKDADSDEEKSNTETDEGTAVRGKNTTDTEEEETPRERADTDTDDNTVREQKDTDTENSDTPRDKKESDTEDTRDIKDSDTEKKHTDTEDDTTPRNNKDSDTDKRDTTDTEENITPRENKDSDKEESRVETEDDITPREQKDSDTDKDKGKEVNTESLNDTDTATDTAEKTETVESDTEKQQSDAEKVASETENEVKSDTESDKNKESVESYSDTFDTQERSDTDETVQKTEEEQVTSSVTINQSDITSETETLSSKDTEKDKASSEATQEEDIKEEEDSNEAVKPVLQEENGVVNPELSDNDQTTEKTSESDEKDDSDDNNKNDTENTSDRETVKDDDTNKDVLSSEQGESVAGDSSDTNKSKENDVVDK